MKNSKNILLSISGLFAVMLSSQAHANFSWTFDSYPIQGNCEAASVGNKCIQSDTDAGKTIGVTATGWASSNNSINSSLEKATLKRWDGLAVNAVGEDTGQPQHATDNNGKFESIKFAFDDAVTLTSITMGWHEDADFSLLRYTGNDAANLTGKTYDNLITNGWELVGNYTYSKNLNTETDITASVDGSDNSDDYDGPMDENQSAKTLNPDNLSSSYWLVTALNGAFWNNPQGYNYIGNDYFKVKNLTGTFKDTQPDSGSVPEPSSLLLLLLAMIGWKISNNGLNRFDSSLKIV